MAESQKKTYSSVSLKEKDSLLADLDIGNDFFSSWKPMSMADGDGMDFDLKPGNKKSFNFDKSDIDFNLDGDFGKMSSFNMDMSDLDISPPLKKDGQPKEKPKESSGGKNKDKTDQFTFAFDFDELDNFNFDSSLPKEGSKDHKDKSNKESPPGRSECQDEEGCEQMKQIGSMATSEDGRHMPSRPGTVMTFDMDSLVGGGPDLEPIKENRPSVSIHEVASDDAKTHPKTTVASWELPEAGQSEKSFSTESVGLETCTGNDIVQDWSHDSLSNNEPTEVNSSEAKDEVDSANTNANVRENKKHASEIHKLPLVSQPSERPEKETEEGREPLVTCLKPYIQSEKSGCPVPEVASARTTISSLTSKKMGFTEPTLFEGKRERAQSDQKLVSLSMQYSKTELPQIQRQDSGMALEIYREVNKADGLDNEKKMIGPSTTQNKDTEKSRSVLRPRETSMKDLDTLSCTAVVSYIKGGKVFIVADGQSSITSGGEVDEVVEIASESKQKITIVKERYAMGLSGSSLFGEKFVRQMRYLVPKRNFSEMCDCLNEFTKKWKKAAHSPSCVIVVGFDAKEKKMVIDKMSNFDPPQRRVKYTEEGNMCEIGSGSLFIRQQFNSLSAKGYFQNASEDAILRGLISCVLLPCVRLDCCSGFLSQATVDKDRADLKVTGDAVKLLGELFDLIDDDEFRNSGLFLSVSQTCRSLIDFKEKCKALSTSYDIIPLKSGVDLGYVVWIVYARAGNQIHVQRTHLDFFPEGKLVATSKRNLQLLARHPDIK